MAKQKTEPAPVPAETNGAVAPADHQIVPMTFRQIVPAWTRINNIQEAVAIAELVAKSAAIPDCRNAGVALLKMLAGAEMGFGPFASLTGVDMIEGKPSVGAHLKAAAIKNSDRYDYHVVEGTETTCRLAFYERCLTSGGEVRKGLSGWKQVGTEELTIETAHARGMTQGKEGVKRNWRVSGGDMLFARCISRGYKRYCPDLTGGIRTYDPDELDDGEQPIDVSFVQRTPEPVQLAPPEPAPPEKITSEQFDEIESIVGQLGKSADDVNALLTKMFGAGEWSVSALDERQVVRVINRLRKALAEKEKADAQPAESAPS